MKVLHYSPKFSVTSETFIYDQIITLQQLGVECSVVTNKRMNVLERPFDPIFILPFKKLISERVTQKFAFGKRFELLPFFINYADWKGILHSLSPDLIHCHTGNAVKAWYHIRAKLNCNLPLLISLHGSDVTMEPFLKKSYRQCLMSIAQDCNVLWTVPSDFLKKKAIDVFHINPSNIIVVNNGFNDKFDSSQTEPLPTNDEIKILSIGRFISCKGHEYILRAMPELLECYPSCTLTIVGDGPLFEANVKLAQELNIKEKVTFIRSLQHKEIAELMREHHYYVQPSIRDELTLQEESFGVAALEAIASGLPAVVTNCGGLPEVIALLPDEYGKVVPQKDASSITQALKILIKNNKRIPDNWVHLVKDKFSMENNALQIQSLYKLLIQ
ncbi:glycosyltransferase family 4 protein [Thalassotalea piscium]